MILIFINLNVQAQMKEADASAKLLLQQAHAEVDKLRKENVALRKSEST